MTSPITAPQFLWLEITGRCQLECAHCYADSSPDGTHGTMTIEDWSRVIDDAAELGVRTVQFIGGEPTLHPGLVHLVNHALSRALAVEVFSNLVHVTEEHWVAFAQPGVSLATSYYSDDPGEHAAITGRPSHPRTKANIAEAVRRGIPIRAGVIDVAAGQRTKGAHDELVDLGVPAIGYDRLRQIGRGVRDRQESASQLCGRCGDGAAAVGPDGTVTPCVMARWHVLGNVRDDSLDELASVLPEARRALVAQGMPETVAGGCRPGGGGNPCYPENEAVAAGCRPGGGGNPCYPENEAVTGGCRPGGGGNPCYPENEAVARVGSARVEG